MLTILSHVLARFECREYWKRFDILSSELNNFSSPEF